MVFKVEIIALLTDFGERDYFAGSLKGAILSINPDAQIVDISHQVPKQDVRTGAFILLNAAKTFPKGTKFVAVVDPGVGTERRCILLRTENGLSFVGPDNGIFTLVAREFGIKEVREVSNEDLMLTEVSNTFHGRDVMAPVAAHLSLGVEPEYVGKEAGDMKLLDITEPEVSEEGIRGQVLQIDDFGNIITNIRGDSIEDLIEPGTAVRIETEGSEFEAPFVKTFGEVTESEKLCYIGGAGLLEIGKNQGNLAEETSSKKSDELYISQFLKE